MLNAYSEDGSKTYASEADKGKSYYCPACIGKVIVKQGMIRVWHYAHDVANPTCPESDGESPAHLEMKDGIYRALGHQSWVQQRDVEHWIGQRRADVWARTIKGDVAFEAQVSPLTVEELQAKLIDYNNTNTYCLYIVHASAISKKFNLRSLDGEEVRVAAWIRGLHALYLGRVYVWQAGKIYPVHFETIERYAEEAHNSNGDEVGGYSYFLKDTRTLKVGEAIKNTGIICTVSQSKARVLPITARIARFTDRKFW